METVAPIIVILLIYVFNEIFYIAGHKEGYKKAYKEIHKD